jgi:hypothetical protein
MRSPPFDKHGLPLFVVGMETWFPESVEVLQWRMIESPSAVETKTASRLSALHLEIYKSEEAGIPNLGGIQFSGATLTRDRRRDWRVMDDAENCRSGQQIWENERNGWWLQSHVPGVGTKDKSRPVATSVLFASRVCLARCTKRDETYMVISTCLFKASCRIVSFDPNPPKIGHLRHRPPATHD